MGASTDGAAVTAAMPLCGVAPSPRPPGSTGASCLVSGYRHQDRRLGTPVAGGGGSAADHLGVVWRPWSWLRQPGPGAVLFVLPSRWAMPPWRPRSASAPGAGLGLGSRTGEHLHRRGVDCPGGTARGELATRWGLFRAPWTSGLPAISNPLHGCCRPTRAVHGLRRIRHRELLQWPGVVHSWPSRRAFRSPASRHPTAPHRTLDGRSNLIGAPSGYGRVLGLHRLLRLHLLAGLARFRTASRGPPRTRR